jgi:hypothetical protein
MSKLPSIQGFFIYRGKAKQKKEQEEKGEEKEKEKEKEKGQEQEKNIQEGQQGQEGQGQEGQQGQEGTEQKGQEKNRQGEIVGIVIITTISDGKKVFIYSPINQYDLITDTHTNALLQELLRNNKYSNRDTTYDYDGYFDHFMKHITGIKDFSSDNFFSFNDTHSD